MSAWSSGYLTRAEVNATVAAAKKAKLTALFIQVRKNGDAYYTSATEPPGDGVEPGLDPLAYVIQKAHEQGIQVHAWFNAVRIWASKQQPTDPRHIVLRHPEWINKDYCGNTRATEGLYLDPGIPEARQYIASLVEEIATSYDVDGVHLDYIRHPGKDWGYSDLALQRYHAATGSADRPQPGDPRWLEWKREQVTELVRLVRQKVKAAKPGLTLSAATVAWGDCPSDFRKTTAYASLCQDWKRWLAEGLIDANCPMNYKDEKRPARAREFRRWLNGFRGWSAGRPTYVGIEIYMNQVPQILRQIEATRKAGLEGFMLFSFNQSPRREAISQAVGTVSIKR